MDMQLRRTWSTAARPLVAAPLSHKPVHVPAPEPCPKPALGAGMSSRDCARKHACRLGILLLMLAAAPLLPQNRCRCPSRRTERQFSTPPPGGRFPAR
jgi:hypothetical protein